MSFVYMMSSASLRDIPRRSFSRELSLQHTRLIAGKCDNYNK